METQEAIDWGREAITTGLWVAGPILIAGLVIGLIVGILQAMTQVQDQTVAFTPKIILMIVVLGLCLPWLAGQMVEYSKTQLSTVPEQINTAEADWSVDTQWR
jgi:flagellar biosynthetic protein FliQ